MQTILIENLIAASLKTADSQSTNTRNDRGRQVGLA